MKDEINENEVYFLGQDRPIPKRQRNSFSKWKVVIGMIVIIALSIAGSLTWSFHKGGKAVPVLEGEILDTVSILPQGSKMPRFNGTDDMSVFMDWVCKHLVYPKGVETEKELVVVSFIIQTDGKLGGFNIRKAPLNKAFEEAVINLLEQSPEWEPAELPNGKKVNMKYTLPVLFRNE